MLWGKEELSTWTPEASAGTVHRFSHSFLGEAEPQGHTDVRPLLYARLSTQVLSTLTTVLERGIPLPVHRPFREVHDTAYELVATQREIYLILAVPTSSHCMMSFPDFCESALLKLASMEESILNS